MRPLAERILFATDFSDCAVRAYDYALFVAAACSAQLEVLHVLEFQPGMDPEYPVNHLYLEHLRRETRAQLNELVQCAERLGLKVTGHQAIGTPSEEINKLARKSDADLIVLGTHGRTGLERILLGSTAERVVSGAPCPVLTVRQTAPSPAFRHILAPVDFSDCSLDALEYAVQVAEQFSAPVTILHVMEPVSYSLDFTLAHAGEARAQRERLEARLEELTATLRRKELRANSILRGGIPVDSVLDWSREEAYDLIVMGTHGRRGISHLISGSVAEAVLRRASCPVLTVKSPKFSPDHRPVAQP